MDEILKSSFGAGNASPSAYSSNALGAGKDAHLSSETPIPAKAHFQTRSRLGSSSMSRPFNRPTSTYSNASTSVTRPSTASGRKSRATNASSILGVSETDGLICAICEARGVSPSVGVAFLNVSLGEAVLSQICDNQSYVKTIHKIQMMCPSRIVCMSSITKGSQESTVALLLNNLLPDTPLDEVDRSAWSEAKGIAYINKLAFEADVQPIQVALQGKYYAVCSFAAVSCDKVSCVTIH